MAIYRFSFDDKYAGHTAVVTNATGGAVSGSPITLDANGDGTLDLITGIYKAQVDNAQYAFGDGYSVVNGELDLGASLDAAGGGSGGVDHSGDTKFLFEINNGLSLSASSGFTTLIFDTGPDGYTGSLSHPAVPPGLYSVWIELDFDQPAENRVVSIRASSSVASAVAGPFPISAVGGIYGDIAFMSAVLAVPDADTTGVTVSVARAVVASGGTPAALNINYGSIVLSKIA